jgi:predicted outer membrane repeat protein
VYGGFAGGETSLSQRDLATNVAILSGDLAGDDASNVFTDNSLHVLNGAGGNSSTVYDGFTVRGGNADGSANDGRGGGILCVTGDNPTVRNCTFTANRCALGGGAGYINNSSPTFLSCTFDANFGASFGGALDMVTNVGATLDRCVFKNNSAVRAGAIEIYGSSPVKVSNSLFFANTCTGPEGGGAIYVRDLRNADQELHDHRQHRDGERHGRASSPSGGTPIVTNCIVLQKHRHRRRGRSRAGDADGDAGEPFARPCGLHGHRQCLDAARPSIPAAPYPYRLAAGSVGIDAGSKRRGCRGFRARPRRLAALRRRAPRSPTRASARVRWSTWAATSPTSTATRTAFPTPATC